MSRAATILRNVASNWVGFAVNAAVTLALTPVILRELGTARYGIWILTSSIVGYYGFLDLGFRAGITQYLTRYLAIRNYEQASDCMSSAVVVLSMLGALMAVLSVGAAYISPHVFDLPLSTESEAFWCILIVGCSSASQFALSPYTSIFTALQRFDLANLIGVGSRLLTAGAIVTALWMGYGLIGVSVATCGASLADYLLRWRVACGLAPEIVVSRRRFNLKRFRDFGTFGAWNFLISVNTYVYQHVPNILIGLFMPIAAIGHYALATGLFRQVNSVLSPVGQVVYPVAVEMHVKGDRTGRERLYHDGSRLMILVTIPIVLIAMTWAEDFYRLWVGERFLSSVPFHSVALLFQALLISTVTCYVSSIGQQILIGAGKIRLVATALIFGSIINLSLTLALLPRYGLAGVTAATVIASVVVDLIAMPLMVQRVIGMPVLGFLRNACVRPVAAGILQALVIGGIRLTGPAGDWLQLILQGTLAGAGSVAVLLTVGISGEERQRFVADPLRRFCKMDKNVQPLPDLDNPRKIVG